MVFVASFVQGLTGFGLAVICTPLLSLVLPVRLSVPVAALCGFLVTIPIVASLFRHIRWWPVALLVASALPGIWLGARLLSGVPTDWILGAMGCVLIGLGCFHLANGQVPEALNGWWLGVGSGFLAGAVGAATAAPGPPLVAYLSLQKWDTRELKAVMNVFFLLQGAATVPAYLHDGLITGKVLRALTWAFPVLVIGLAMGLFASHSLRHRQILVRTLVNVAILLLGLAILCKAAYGLLL